MGRLPAVTAPSQTTVNSHAHDLCIRVCCYVLSGRDLRGINRGVLVRFRGSRRGRNGPKAGKIRRAPQFITLCFSLILRHRTGTARLDSNRRSTDSKHYRLICYLVVVSVDRASRLCLIQDLCSSVFPGLLAQRLLFALRHSPFALTEAQYRESLAKRLILRICADVRDSSIRMSQQLLHQAHWLSEVHEMAGEGMSKRMEGPTVGKALRVTLKSRPNSPETAFLSAW